jgi:sugar-specific transcriptional regulator TrmB
VDIQSLKDLEDDYRQVSDTLMTLGLSKYEANAYIALIALGYGDAETIAETAEIPRTSSYKVLQSLERKGFAIATEGRPKLFKPEPPSKIRDQIINRVDETFGKLEFFSEILSEKGMPQLVFTITGKDKVLNKIGELIDKSTEKLIISTANFSVIRDGLAKNLQNAARRGIQITVITSKRQRIPKYINGERREGLIATDVIADGKYALLASAELDACGYTDNPTLAQHLEQFLQILITSDNPSM